MKKTLIALTAIVTLAGLANADVIRSEATGLIAGDRIMTVEAAQQCWQEQMEKLFTDFEPQRKGTPLWQPIARPIAKFQALTAKSTTSMQWEALVARPVEGFRGGPAEDFAQDRGRHQTRPGPRGGDAGDSP